MSDTVHLRGHHLLCMLTYRGEGYTPEFIRNFDAIIDRINRGTIIEITVGLDDVCGALRQCGTAACNHARVCRKESVRRRDVLALRDVARALRKPLFKKGQNLIVKKVEVRYLRQLFLHGGIRNACQACPLHSLCTDIAAGGFKDAKLSP